MSKSTNTNYILPLAVVLIGCAIFLYMKNGQEDQPIDEGFATNNTHVEVDNPASIPEQVTPVVQVPSEVKDEVAQTPDPEVLSNQERVKKEQAQILENFQNQVHMKMKFLENMNYKPLDLSEKVAGIYGRDPVGQSKMVVLATRDKVEVGDVVKFLKEEKRSLPILTGRDFIPGQAQTIPTSVNPSFRAITVIPGGQANGLDVYAVLAHRADNKGSYLFMMEAKPGYFQGNDDGFEAMMKTVEVLP